MAARNGLRGERINALRDGPKGGCHGWQAIKKKTPRLRGLCRLCADILDLLAILAAVPRIPVAKVRFLRDVHRQQISHRPAFGIVAICSMRCKPWLTPRETEQTLGFIL